jgi:hypothetical protein
MDQLVSSVNHLVVNANASPTSLVVNVKPAGQVTTDFPIANLAIVRQQHFAKSTLVNVFAHLG